MTVVRRTGKESAGKPSRGCWDGARFHGGGLTLAKTVREPETCITGMVVLLQYDRAGGTVAVGLAPQPAATVRPSRLTRSFRRALTYAPRMPPAHLPTSRPVGAEDKVLAALAITQGTALGMVAVLEGSWTWRIVRVMGVAVVTGLSVLVAARGGAWGRGATAVGVGTAGCALGGVVSVRSRRDADGAAIGHAAVVAAVAGAALVGRGIVTVVREGTAVPR